MSKPTDAALGELSDALLSLARVYQLRDRDRICRHGITVSQCYALEAIVAGDGLRVTELARALGLDKSTSSRVAESLCALGLARYEDEQANRRAKRVVPTRKGRALDTRIHDEIAAEHLAIFDGFDRKEVEVATRLLKAVATARTTR